jgi:hypothetical protein
VEEAQIDLVSEPGLNNILINGENCEQTHWVHQSILPGGLLVDEEWQVVWLASGRLPLKNLKEISSRKFEFSNRLSQKPLFWWLGSHKQYISLRLPVGQVGGSEWLLSTPL